MVGPTESLAHKEATDPTKRKTKLAESLVAAAILGAYSSQLATGKEGYELFENSG